MKITKESLIFFAEHYKKFRIEDVYKIYLNLYKEISIISEKDEALIKQKVEKNVNLLMNESLL